MSPLQDRGKGHVCNYHGHRRHTPRAVFTGTQRDRTCNLGTCALQLLQLHKYLIFKKQKLKKNSPRRWCNLLRANKGCKCQEQGVGPKVVSVSLRRGVQLLHITHSKYDGSFLWSLIPSVWKILGLFWWAKNR